MNERLSTEKLALLVQTALKINGFAKISVVGTSMQPMLYHNRDEVVVIKPTFPLKKGDIAFFRFSDNLYLLHRVIRVNKDGTYTFRGDNKWDDEENITENQIIGVVKSFVHNGKKVIIGKSFKYELYKRFWFILHYFKKYYAIIRCAKSIVFNIKKYCYKVHIKAKTGERKMVDIVLRAARNSDIEEIMKLGNSLAIYEKEEYDNFLVCTDWFISDSGRRIYQKSLESEFLWVAYDKNKCIGFCRGNIINSMHYNGQIGQIVNIFVAEKYRYLGIGEKLISQFKQYCKEKDCKYIWVNFMEKNEKAKSFYVKNGFSGFTETFLCELDK